MKDPSTQNIVLLVKQGLAEVGLRWNIAGMCFFGLLWVLLCGLIVDLGVGVYLQLLEAREVMGRC